MAWGNCNRSKMTCFTSSSTCGGAFDQGLLAYPVWALARIGMGTTMEFLAPDVLNFPIGQISLL